MNENINDTRSKTELCSVKDPLKIHRTAPNERALVSESPNIINEVNVIIAPGQEETTALILSEELCEEQSLHCLLLIGKFSYNPPQDVSTSPV